MQRTRLGLSVLAVIVTTVTASLLGCGRYGAPLAPESLAPQVVEKIAVIPTERGVTFSFLAPLDDLRGKEVKFIDGYRIYRQDLSAGDEESFEVIADVEDHTVVRRDDRREAARASGKPGYRINLKEEERTLTYLDTSVASGVRYRYQIKPYNQGGVLGAVDTDIFVTFLGTNSVVEMVPVDSATDD